MRRCSDTDRFFKCVTDDKCISKSLTCDEVADCADGSDESESVCGDPLARGVPRKKCDVDDEFECEANICISKKLVCDSVNHCSDGRDEAPDLCADRNVSNSEKLGQINRQNCRPLAPDSFVTTSNACRAIHGCVMGLTIAKTEVTNITAIVTLPTANSCASQVTIALRLRKYAMGRMTASIEVTRADCATRRTAPAIN